MKPLRHSVDILLVALAVVFGAGSLTWPFGHDQALYYYVGREWLLRGSIPYRDVFDHKTPGIYAVHALSIAIFGENTWGIRVIELAATVALGAVAARVTVPKERDLPRGLVGVGALASSVLYYGFFDFWSSAQSELLYSLLGLASICAALRMASPRSRGLVAGVAGALAMVMKPPAVWFVLLAFTCGARLAFRARDRLRAAGTFALFFAGGFGLVVVLVLSYFGVHGALAAMADIVIGANGYYVTHERGISGPGDALVQIFFFVTQGGSLALVLVAGLLLGLARELHRQRLSLDEPHAVGALAWCAGLAAVAMQQKFYWLHWVAVLGPTVLLATTCADDLASVTRDRWTRWSSPLLFVPILIVAFFAPLGPSRMWRTEAREALRWAGGEESREEHARHFRLDFMYFFADDSLRAGDWLRAHVTAGDVVAVRGFNPEIYQLSDTHFSGRFFWTLFLTEPRRAYRRQAYLDEDRAVFTSSTPPRFAVGLIGVGQDVDSAGWLLQFGYVERARFGPFAILELEPSSRPPSPM